MTLFTHHPDLARIVLDDRRRRAEREARQSHLRRELRQRDRHR